MKPFAASITLALALLYACAGKPAGETRTGDSRPTGERVTADTPHATAAGTTFTVPTDWRVTTVDNMAVLEAPEGDAHLVLVDTTARDADSAVAEMWARYRPGPTRPLRLVLEEAPRNGWEERHSYSYETSPNEKLSVDAGAWRTGTTWVSLLSEGSNATSEKRRSQISLFFNSVRPKDYRRETFADRKAHPLDAQRIEILKTFVADGMKQLNVPGVGLAFIDRGKVVWEGGLGVRELGKPALIDAHTRFMAASNTKALTTLLLATLVDEGRLRWDQPVTEVYPPFKLGDADTTRQVLVRHLICACTGLPRQDYEWILEFGNATPATAMALLGTMQPTSAFGALFQYSNPMAAAAGYIGGALVHPDKELGAAYDAAMYERVFRPLGMTRTTFDFALAQRGNWARPHGAGVDGRMSRAQMGGNHSIIHVRPTGGVWTSAHDLARYVEMELAGGLLPDGARLVSTENLAARHAAQVQVSEDIHYGMGLFADLRWGVPVARHGGSMLGFQSDMIWLPEHGVGAVILTNADAGALLRGPLLRRMLEVLFDGKPEAEAQLRVAAKQYWAQIGKMRERLVVPAEAETLAARYKSPQLGSLTVRREAGKVMFDFDEWSTIVASRRNDDGTLSFISADPGLLGFFDFVVAERDGRRALVARAAQQEYVFTEVGAP
jgi:CubicO group peptidase (beta-lactamase class C family)